jgi:hypothetical protein
VEPGATARDQIDPADDYGVTWAEGIEVGLTVAPVGDQWVPQVTGLVGLYSVQAAVMEHQTDVTDAGVATAVNFTEILGSLEALGMPSEKFAYYSTRAIEAHEDVHVAQVGPALETVSEQITQELQAVTVPVAGAADAGAAEEQIRSASAFRDVLDPEGYRNGYDNWKTALEATGSDDHQPDGPCQQAERSINRPLIAAISERAYDQDWPLPVPPSTVAAAD